MQAETAWLPWSAWLPLYGLITFGPSIKVWKINNNFAFFSLMGYPLILVPLKEKLLMDRPSIVSGVTSKQIDLEEEDLRRPVVWHDSPVPLKHVKWGASTVFERTPTPIETSSPAIPNYMQILKEIHREQLKETWGGRPQSPPYLTHVKHLNPKKKNWSKAKGARKGRVNSGHNLKPKAKKTARGIQQATKAALTTEPASTQKLRQSLTAVTWEF